MKATHLICTDCLMNYNGFAETNNYEVFERKELKYKHCIDLEQPNLLTSRCDNCKELYLDTRWEVVLTDKDT